MKLRRFVPGLLKDPDADCQTENASGTDHGFGFVTAWKHPRAMDHHA